MALHGVEKVAKALNVTVRRVNQLVHEGMPREDRGKYDLGQCMLWYIRYLQKALERREVPGAGEDGAGASLRLVRQRLITAQAEREELDLARARAELIPIHLYESEMSRQIMSARQHFLTLPGRLSPQLEGLGRTEIKTRLDVAMRGALTAMSAEANTDAGNSPRSTSGAVRSEHKAGAAVGAAANTNGKRLGGSKQSPNARD